MSALGDKMLSETAGYSISTSMIDVPGAAILRFIWCLCVWIKTPDKVALIPIFLSIVHICYKSQIFVYTWDIDGYEYFYADAWGIMGLSLTFCGLEGVLSVLANVKTRQTRRRYARFRVAGDRCPLCTLPLDKCKHKIIPGKGVEGMQVINMWHRDVFHWSHNVPRCCKLTLCPACPCAAGEIAEALGRNPFVFCCWYAAMAPGCLCGAHAVVGAANRAALRQQDKLEGSLIRDFLYHWFCCACAFVQEHAQLAKMEEDKVAQKRREEVDAKAELRPEDVVTVAGLLADMEDGEGRQFGDDNAIKAAQVIQERELEKAGHINAKLAAIRQKQFQEDLGIAMKELKSEVFHITEDPDCPDGGVPGTSYGHYQNDCAENSQWVPAPRNSAASDGGPQRPHHHHAPPGAPGDASGGWVRSRPGSRRGSAQRRRRAKSQVGTRQSSRSNSRVHPGPGDGGDDASYTGSLVLDDAQPHHQAGSSSSDVGEGEEGGGGEGQRRQGGHLYRQYSSRDLELAFPGVGPGAEGLV